MSYWDSADGNLGTTILIMLCSLSDKKEAFQHFALSGKKMFQKEDESIIEIRKTFYCGESQRMASVSKNLVG